MIKPTTALRKICALVKRIWCLQGSQGAAKTYSVCIILINHLAQKKNKECYIVSEELSKMRDTVVKDCVNIINTLGLKCKMLGIEHGSPKIIFPTGSFIRFIGLDKEDVGKGLRSDIVYVNEANKINFETYRELTSRAKKVIIDYNPNVEFWAHTEVIPRKDCDYLELTFEDNEFLSEEERNEILNYKTKAYFNTDLPEHQINNKDNIKSQYWLNKWRVYGQGKTGGVEGVVYENWTTIDNIPKTARLLGYGLDFGYTNDPTAIVSVWKNNDLIIVNEEVYQTGLLNSDIIKECKDIGITRKTTIYADSAEPKSIAEIKKSGIGIRGATKGRDSINYGIDLIQQQTFIVTSSSHNLIKELNSYKWDEDRTGKRLNKPIDKNNHALDAFRYWAVMSLKTKKKRTLSSAPA